MQPIPHEATTHRRKQAEEILKSNSRTFADIDISDTSNLLNELRIHQIELEIQNEELREAQEHIENARDRYADLYDFAPVGYLTIEEGRIIEANLTSAKMLGHEITWLINKPFSDLVFKDDLDTYHLDFNRMFEDHLPMICEIKLITGAGVEFLAKLECAPVGKRKAQVPQYRVIISDVTSEKAAEAIEQENELLRVTIEKEKELGKLRERLMLTISHEFRTPLTVISTSVYILDRHREKISEQIRREKFDIIQEQITLITKMLDDVMLAVNAQTKQLHFRPALVNPLALCTQVVDKIQARVESSHRISLTHQGEMKPYLLDSSLIMEMLNNLLVNAVKYSPDGGKIDVTLSIQDKALVFEVSDEGLGITPEDQLWVFEAFYRAKNVDTIKGIGVGLGVTKAIVELHGGVIECESAEGTGTTFTIRLPIEVG